MENPKKSPFCCTLIPLTLAPLFCTVMPNAEGTGVGRVGAVRVTVLYASRSESQSRAAAVAVAAEESVEARPEGIVMPCWP